MAKKEPVPTTKSGLMVALAAAGEVKKAQAVAIYDKLIALAYEGARQNEKGWLIPGLGKLLIKKQSATRRRARNSRSPRARSRSSASRRPRRTRSFRRR